ncbi:uncharacterized protein ACNLHF_001557 isoform 1-T2 [Anomaloglossus baeobatrachus]|uniref:uncharacterized protein LOC142256132 n=1 Tax=Anomaloglossus baeobatrachus TaxID=238106 RepID=UPI003F506436
MRGFVVTLALLFLTGTQARYLLQHDELQSPAQHVREVIESYLHKVKDLGREAVSQVESSDLGKQLELKIAEMFDTPSPNALALNKQLNPYVDRVREHVSSELEKDIPLIREKIRPMIENFQKNWAENVNSFRGKVAPLVEELRKETKDNLEVFNKKLQLAAKVLRQELRSEVHSLRTNLAPHADQLRKKMIENLEVKANAGPKTEEYKSQIAQQIETLKENVGPLVDDLKELLLPHAEEAKAKIDKLWEAVRARLAQNQA